MKRAISLAVLTFLSTLHSSQAVLLQEGVKELGLRGHVDFTTSDGAETELDLTAGYFLMDGVEAGLLALVSDSDSSSRLGIGGFAEVNYDIASFLIPYVGGSLTLQGAEIDLEGKSNNESALVLGLSCGAKYFMVENVAADVRAQLNIASEDIYPDGKDIDAYDFIITLGLRFFFQ